MNLPLEQFHGPGRIIMVLLGVVAGAGGLVGIANLASPRPLWPRLGGRLLLFACLVFGAGFLLICWFHYQIYLHLPLDLP